MKEFIKIYPNVTIDEPEEIGDFVIIGYSFKEMDDNVKTFIGKAAIIRSHTVIYAGNIIGMNFRTGHHVIIRELNKIGDNVSIGSGSIIEHHVEIGNNVRLHSGVFIPEYTILEDGSWLGPCVCITNAKYPLSKDAKKTLKGATIKKNAKIGANVTLLPGVVIGENSLVGAGSVVVKNVPPGKVVAGNPARIIKDIEDLPSYNKKAILS